MKVPMSFQSIALAFALAFLPVAAAHGQDSTNTSERLWASVGAGYASPGLAGIAEVWITNGPVVYGLVVENTTHGGFDHTYSTIASSLLGGVRQSIGPVRATVAIGGSFGDHGGGNTGLRPVWQVGVDLPFTHYMALHVATSALIGAPDRHSVETIGLSFGMVR
jgi:hypothetical protein